MAKAVSKKGGMSNGQKRKARYAAFAESDKSGRNKQIEDALGRGEKNVEAIGMTETVEEIVTDPKTLRTFKKKVKVTYDKALIDVAMPSSDSSRSGKRARLKLSRARKVTPVKHYKGPCGNIGCKQCNPSQH